MATDVDGAGRRHRQFPTIDRVDKRVVQSSDCPERVEQPTPADETGLF